LARLTEAGRAATVVTATRGEKGSSDPAEYDRPSFALHRERELRSALAEVGVHDLHLLGYRDGECDLVPEEEAITSIAAVMRDVRPDMVLTFGPDGITGHGDHRAVSRWTTEAWRRTQAGELLYATMTDGFVERNVDLHARIGIFGEFGLGGPVSYPRVDIAMEHDLSEAELDRKRQVLAHHASQSDGLAELMGEETYRSWWRTEWFRRPTVAELAGCPLAERIVGVTEQQRAA
jgi:LmbE family N-acetylglucosaminyl deacetylase